MDYIWLALISAFCGSMANMLARKIMKYCGNAPEEYIPIHYSIITVMLLPFLPFFYKLELNYFSTFMLIMVYVIDLFANYFYLKSFEIQRVYKISILVSTAPLFSLLLYPFLGSAMNLNITEYDFLGILITILGIIIINYKKKEQVDDMEGLQEETGFFRNIAEFWKDRIGSFKKKKMIYPLAAAALMGISVYFMKYLFVSGTTNPYTYYTTRNMIFMLTFLFWMKPNFKEFLGNGENIKWLFFRGAFVIGQWLLLLYAIQDGNPILSKAIADTIPIFVVILSFVIWKVKLRPRKIVGILISLIGVSIITLL